MPGWQPINAWGRRLSRSKKEPGMDVFQNHRSYLHFLRFLAVFVLLVAAQRATYAQVARMEVIPFESLTLTDQEFLAGHEDGKPVTVAGELRLPRAGTGRFPLVILLHPSGGIGGAAMDWGQYFLSMGVATVHIDSLTVRGIAATIDEQRQLGRLAQNEEDHPGAT